MRRPWSKRPSIIALALTAASHLAAPLLPAIALAGAPRAALAQQDPYKQHMETGIKLYKDQNYSAAIVEFQAAYDAKPKASPLLNIALCYKAKFNYPKAIKTLETALEKHPDTMDASDKEASQNAITEMRALLAYITVKIVPAKAQPTYYLDDEELPPGATAEPIPVGPGTHKISARAEGFAPAEQTINVTSGEKPEVKLTLVADKGWVTVQTSDPKTTIAIDQHVVGNGQWAGMLVPGTYVIQMFTPGSPPLNVRLTVVAGKQHIIRPGSNGIPIAPPPVKKPPNTTTPPSTTPPSTTPPSTTPPNPPTRRGFYGLALASILFPATHPPSFPDPSVDFGAGYGLRLGYQVNTYAGFDLSFEHSSIGSGSSASDDAKYRIISNRLAVGLRLLSSGKVVRFAGALGGGPVFDDFTFTLTPTGTAECAARAPRMACPLKANKSVDAFAYLEGGIEFDLDHVLINLAFQGEFEATGNIGDGGQIYNGRSLVNLGPALRIGYRFW